MGGAVDGFRGTSRFVVEARLGEGGMGVVHQVRDVERGEVLALKTMSNVDAPSLVRFKREFRALADISHPNVVQLYELFSEGEQLFFTMELVDGCDLVTWVNSSPSLPPPQPLRPLGTTAVDSSRLPAPRAGGPSTLNDQVTILASPEVVEALTHSARRSPSEPPPAPSVRARFAVRDTPRLRDAFRQLAAGVQAIHAAGKLHRDIKPSNVMVTRDGRVVLLDFGVVGEFKPGRKTVGGDEPLVGTPAYMAPEQAAFRGAIPASDWYAVGVMLFESLTRRMPFEGSTTALLLSKQRPLDAPPSALVEGVPPDLESLCIELLALDPRDRPKGEEVLRRLEGDSVPSLPLSIEVRFVGRQEQLAALRAAFDASLSRRLPVVAMIQGRSGMGKSALAARFLGSLGAMPDVLVLAGRCFERETVPFKAIDQVVDELSRWLARLPEDELHGLLPNGMHALTRVFPVLATAHAGAEDESDAADPLEVRRRAFTALKELLTAVAARHALVVHVDDLQWGDADSVQLLESLLAAPAPSPLLLVCSHRTELTGSSEAIEALRGARERLAGACDFRDFDVEALTHEETRVLASALVESRDPAIADAIASEARGSPLFAAELARWANERREVTRIEGHTAIESVILARVAGLSDDARILLETLSVARGPLKHAIAARAAGIGPRRREATLTLRGARLVSVRGLRDDDLVETSHDRVRETVAASLTEGQRRERHLAIARAFAERADPDSAFEHFRAAGDDASARTYALQAAEAADRGLAFLRAAALYRVAIALRADALDALYARLGDALANAGRGAEAADAYLEAATRAPVREAADLRRIAAEHYLKSGRDAQGRAVLRQVLADAGLHYPESTEAVIASIVFHETRLRIASLVRRVTRVRRAQSLSPKDLARIDAAFTAATGLAVSDPLRSADFGLRALRHALEAGEPVRLGRALAVAAANTAARGESSRRRADELVQAARRVAEQVDDPHALALALLVAGMVHFFLGEWRGARVKLEQAEAILRARCRAVAWELANAEAWTCNALILCGELRKAAARIPAALEEARARDDRFAVMYLTYPACCAHIVADDVDAAWRVTQYATAMSGDTFTAAEWGVFIAASAIERYKGDARGAWERAEAVSPALDRSDLSRVAVLRAFSAFERGLSAVAAAAAGHERTRTLRAAEHFAKSLLRERVAYSSAMGHLLQAGAHAVRKNDERAAGSLDLAIPLLDAADLGYLAACARHRRGQLAGDSWGQGVMARSRAFFAEQNVVSVERCLAMSAPGFDG